MKLPYKPYTLNHPPPPKKKKTTKKKKKRRFRPPEFHTPSPLKQAQGALRLGGRTSEGFKGWDERELRV